VAIFNVNVPAAAIVETPWKLTRLSRQNYFVNHMANPTPVSKIGEAVCQHGFHEPSLEPDSDIYAVRNHLVSVTPVSIDLTSRVEMKSFLAGMEGRFRV
jgi:5'-nucleotidase